MSADKSGMVGRKAMHRNLVEDGIKIRAATFKDRSKYSRKPKHSKKGWE